MTDEEFREFHKRYWRGDYGVPVDALGTPYRFDEAKGKYVMAGAK